MSVASISADRDFRVGAVLNRAWSIFSGNLLFFLGVTALSYIAGFVASFVFSLTFIFAGRAAQSPTIIGVGEFLAFILAIGFAMIGQAVLLVGAFQRLRGELIQAGSALNIALTRFFPLLGLIALWGSSLAAVTFAGLVLAIGLTRVVGRAGVLLTPAFFVPVLVLLVVWVVVIPACVVERFGPIASMRRSAALTKGYRWRILGIILLLLILSAVGNALIQVILAVASPVLAGFGVLAWLAAWTAYWSCAVIMIYHDLRVAKEGVDTEQIAAVFD